MNERIQELYKQAFVPHTTVCPDNNMSYETVLFSTEKFARLLVRECLGIVKSNTYGPAGEYDYSYSDENAAADERAETIYKDISHHFGVEE